MQPRLRALAVVRRRVLRIVLMNVLILKLGATGDVVRTTPFLRCLAAEVSWVTAEKNVPLLRDLEVPVRAVSWEERFIVGDRKYDLVINLEDERETSAFLQTLEFTRSVGAFLNERDELTYSEDARPWFDLSLISRFGKADADRLKLLNRATYQALVFSALNLGFAGERYCLPETAPGPLAGDIALATEAGPVWPMKKWAYFAELKSALEAEGYVVNELPPRATLLEHLADVRGHRCLVSGDSLPMHFALGSGIDCVSIFTCTSPWEIHDYGLLTKMISPLLPQYFYRRSYDARATTAISVKEVYDAVMQRLNAAIPSGC